MIELLSIFLLLMIVLFIGTPVAFGLGFVSVSVILIFLSPSQLAQLARIAYSQSTGINLMIAPLFILMAEILLQAQIAADIFLVLSKWTRKITGGLAISAALASTLFAALCGSSPATAATIGRISIKEMVDRGYQEEFTCGVVAAGGTLGIMIPPSLAMVIFGIITEVSIAKLFVAGILPGLFLAGAIVAYILVRSKLNPDIAGRVKNTASDAHEADKETTATIGLKQDLKLLTPPLLLIVILMAALYTGFATPTEIAGFGSIVAFIFSAYLGRLKTNMLASIFARTAKFSAMISFMIFCGMSLSYVISYMGLPQLLTHLIIDFGVNRWVFLILVYVLWLILGCLIDPTSMIVLTIPFLFPVFSAFDFDPIWLGVVSTLSVEIGMISPPVGLNLFILKAVSNVPMNKIIAGAIWPVGLLLIALVILTVFPQIALFLPSHM